MISITETIINRLKPLIKGVMVVAVLVLIYKTFAAATSTDYSQLVMVSVGVEDWIKASYL
jgi:hypothetical protein